MPDKKTGHTVKLDFHVNNGTFLRISMPQTVVGCRCPEEVLVAFLKFRLHFCLPNLASLRVTGGPRALG